MAKSDQGVVFSIEDARRIRAAVRFFEQFKGQQVPRRRKRSVAMPLTGGTFADPLVLSGAYTTDQDANDETAHTDSWDRENQGDNDGVQVPVGAREVYYDAGDEKLYGYQRLWTLDSKGLVRQIATEIRYIVDAAVACPS